MTEKPDRRIEKKTRGRPSADETRHLGDAILRIARSEFLDLGYDQTTFERIAQRAGTTRTAIYARFPDKASLFARVFAQVAEEICAVDVVELNDELPLRASLAVVAKSLLARATGHESAVLYHMGLGHLRQHPELRAATQTIWRYYIRQIDMHFQDRIKRGKLRLTDPTEAAKFLAEMIFGPFHVAIIYGEQPPQAHEHDELIERCILMFLGGIGRFEIEA